MKRSSISPLLAVLALGAVQPTVAHADVATVNRKTLTLEGARHLVAAVESAAKARHTTGAIAVVDEGGNLMLLERLDETFVAASSIAVGKARTAAQFKKPTRFFEDVIGKGRTAMAALPDFTPLAGGLPLIVEGQVIGAVGVSGAASAKEDEELAALAVAALPSSAPAAAVKVIEKARVTAAFTKGEPLLETPDYKVHASHRSGAGKAEVHTDDTDILYVLSGSATLVTGGSLTEPVTIEPGEIRGKGIQGGERRQLVAGDVVVVPKGVPHWFQDVPGPIDYYAVKVH